MFTENRSIGKACERLSEHECQLEGHSARRSAGPSAPGNTQGSGPHAALPSKRVSSHVCGWRTWSPQRETVVADFGGGSSYLSVLNF